eukprot:7345627-Alexandrium_andersonii.AAC.1
MTWSSGCPPRAGQRGYGGIISTSMAPNTQRTGSQLWLRSSTNLTEAVAISWPPCTRVTLGLP